jgi:hypothetical protein
VNAASSPSRRRIVILAGVVAALYVGLAAGAAALVFDDRVPLGGGLANYPSGEPLLYDGVWTEVASGPLTARASARAFWTGEEVIVLSGDEDPLCADLCGPPDPLTDVAAYNPSTDRWRSLPDVPADKFDRLSAVLEDDSITMPAGVAEQGGGLAHFDVGEDEWETVPIPADPGIDSGSSLPLLTDADHVVLLPTCACPQGAARARVFDLATARWTVLPADPFPSRTARRVATIGDDIYVFASPRAAGGIRGAVLRSEARRWADLPFVPSERRFHQSSAAIGGELIVPDRPPPYRDGTIEEAQDILAFDTRAGAWTVVPPEAARSLASDVDEIPATAAGAATVWIDDRWFAFGGRTTSGLTDRAYTWTPPD